MSVSSIRSASKFRQTVLLIDDQPTVLAIHSAILKSLKLNLKIVTMTDPLEALEWMHNKQVDLIVTDFRMHQMNGMQFVEAINRADDHTPPKAIIVITVMKDIKTHQELISAGASACLTKPVKAEELADMARKLLKQSELIYNVNPLLR
jgi:two-component system, chemotaxis family, chemotaxis protein CheY